MTMCSTMDERTLACRVGGDHPADRGSIQR